MNKTDLYYVALFGSMTIAVGLFWLVIYIQDRRAARHHKPHTPAR